MLAAVHLVDLAAVPLDDEHAAVVRGDREPAAVGGGGEVQYAADPAGRQAAGHGARRGAGGGAISSASSPSASVTQTTCWSPSAWKVRGSLARTPGSAASARAGPSRWVTQWTAPLDRTALPRPVRSGEALVRWLSACSG